MCAIFSVDCVYACDHVQTSLYVMYAYVTNIIHPVEIIKLSLAIPLFTAFYSLEL